MPLLNIAMQGVALCRKKMDPIFEEALKNQGSMEKIRAVCKDNHALSKATIESLKPSIELLNERYILYPLSLILL